MFCSIILIDRETNQETHREQTGRQQTDKQTEIDRLDTQAESRQADSQKTYRHIYSRITKTYGPQKSLWIVEQRVRWKSSLVQIYLQKKVSILSVENTGFLTPVCIRIFVHYFNNNKSILTKFSTDLNFICAKHHERWWKRPSSKRRSTRCFIFRNEVDITQAANGQITVQFQYFSCQSTRRKICKSFENFVKYFIIAKVINKNPRSD